LLYLFLVSSSCSFCISPYFLRSIACILPPLDVGPMIHISRLYTTDLESIVQSLDLDLGTDLLDLVIILIAYVVCHKSQKSGDFIHQPYLINTHPCLSHNTIIHITPRSRQRSQSSTICLPHSQRDHMSWRHLSPLLKLSWAINQTYLSHHQLFPLDISSRFHHLSLDPPTPLHQAVRPLPPILLMDSLLISHPLLRPISR
jgi:hypothetical protein